MEILFLSYSIRIELILLILSGSIAIILAGIYGYAFIRQIREIFFGDKKRDALLSKRNSELLTKRQEGDEDTTETPPPIVLDELENIDAVNIDQLEAALESAE